MLKVKMQTDKELRDNINHSSCHIPPMLLDVNVNFILSYNFYQGNRFITFRRKQRQEYSEGTIIKAPTSMLTRLPAVSALAIARTIKLNFITLYYEREMNQESAYIIMKHWEICSGFIWKYSDIASSKKPKKCILHFIHVNLHIYNLVYIEKSNNQLLVAMKYLLSIGMQLPNPSIKYLKQDIRRWNFLAANRMFSKFSYISSSVEVLIISLRKIA